MIPVTNRAPSAARSRMKAAAEAKKQEARRAHLQSFVDRFKAKASKAVQAQSRVKMLEKMETITAPEDAKKVVFTFPAPEELSPPIINMEGVAVGYGGPPVLRKLSLEKKKLVLIGAPLLPLTPVFEQFGVALNQVHLIQTDKPQDRLYSNHLRHATHHGRAAGLL